ncbi:MAG: sodium-independent anion transporter [Candidatus Latescibacteria bacterium]|nr:sodium-independent anion transporter [Candidatus Latescibacterota bacterium]
MLATLVFFAVRLSRVDPIESRFTARERVSNKTRSVPDRAILLEEGERVQAYRLRGYLFFGSVSPLADHLRQSLTGVSRPLCLLLDFSAVSGFDFSAVSVLGRFLQTANAAGVRVVLSAVSEGLRSGLGRSLPPSVYDELLVEPDVDGALERCEDIVIEAWNADMADERRASLLDHAANDLEHYLERQMEFENLIEGLQGYLTPHEYSSGETIAGPDVSQEDLQLLLSGRASGYDSAGARLFQCGPGNAIWPADAPDQTSVVADEPCRTMVLTPVARGNLEKSEEGLALKLYRYLLGGRLQGERGGRQLQTDSHTQEEDQ